MSQNIMNENKEIEALKIMQKVAEKKLLGVCLHCLTHDSKILSKVVSSIFTFQFKMLEEFLFLIENKKYYSANLVAGSLFENFVYLTWIMLDKSEERAQNYFDYAHIYNITNPNLSPETLQILSKFIKDNKKSPQKLDAYYDSWALDKHKGKNGVVSISSMCKRIGERYKDVGGDDISHQLQLAYRIFCSYKHCEPLMVTNHNWGDEDNLVQERSALQNAYLSLLQTLKIVYTYFHPNSDLDCSEFLIY